MPGSAAQRLRARRTLGAALVAAVLGGGSLLAAAPPSGAVARPAAAKPLVVAFGDSLITQAVPLLTSSMRNARVQIYSFPGFAACNYLGSVRHYLTEHRPRVAILEFWGDDSKQESPCMTSPTESPGYYLEYEQDLLTMTKEFVKAGAHVFIVGTIPDASQVAKRDRLWDHLNDLYAKIPGKFSRRVASFVNVQTVIERDGAFTWYLPCLRAEPSCGAQVAGVTTAPPSGDNVVRSKEGLHFCPEFPTTSSLYYNFVHCDAYASGTYRYASAIVAAVEAFLVHQRAPRYVGQPLPKAGSVPVGVPGQVDPYTGKVYPQPATSATSSAPTRRAPSTAKRDLPSPGGR